MPVEVRILPIPCRRRDQARRRSGSRRAPGGGSRQESPTRAPGPRGPSTPGANGLRIAWAGAVAPPAPRPVAAAGEPRPAAGHPRQVSLHPGLPGHAGRAALPALPAVALRPARRPVRRGRLGPLLASALLGGAIADRMDRRRLLLLDQIGLVLTAGGLAAAAFAGHPPIVVLYILGGHPGRVRRAGERNRQRPWCPTW